MSNEINKKYKIPKIGLEVTNHSRRMTTQSEEISDLINFFDGYKIDEMTVIVRLENKNDVDNFISLLKTHKPNFVK